MKSIEGNKHIVQLKNQMERLGLPERLHQFIDYHYEMRISEFTIPHWIHKEGSLTQIELNYTADQAGQSNLDSIDISYRRPIEIEDIKAAGISSVELDERMANINWTYDHFTISMVNEEMKTEKGRNGLNYINDTLRDFDLFTESSAQAEKTAKLLIYKHWISGYYHRFATELEELKQKYECSRSVKIVDDSAISIASIIEQLKEQSRKAMQVTHSETKELSDRPIKKQTRKKGQSL